MFKKTKERIVDEAVSESAEISFSLAEESLERDEDLVHMIEQVLTISETNSEVFATVSNYILNKLGDTIIEINTIAPNELEKLLGKDTVTFSIDRKMFAIISKAQLKKLAKKKGVKVNNK